MRHVTALYISRHFIVLSLLLYQWLTKNVLVLGKNIHLSGLLLTVYIKKKWKKSHIGLYKLHYCSKVSVIIDCLHKKGWKNPTSLYEFYNCSIVSVFVNTDFFLCSIYIHLYITCGHVFFFTVFPSYVRLFCSSVVPQTLPLIPMTKWPSSIKIDLWPTTFENRMNQNEFYDTCE